jgi:prepilin-type N-terminal cleavage/methylation domain-containing protein
MQRFIPHRYQPDAGFTLLELIAVIVIAAVLAAIAAPSWVRYVNNQRINAVQGDMLQTIRQAQEKAIKERRNITISVPTTAALPSVTVGTQTTILGDQDVIKPNTMTLDVAAYNSAGTSKDDDDAQTLTFDYQGRASVKKGTTNQSLPYVVTITAKNTNRKKCVMVYNILGSTKALTGNVCDNPKASL